MESGQAQKIAIMAAIAAIPATLATRRLPRWLRVSLVFSAATLACAAGLLGYRYATHPVTLTVATGSIDGDATRLTSLVAARMAAADSQVRLKVTDKGTALDAVNAFVAGDTDLAIVRADVGDLSAARTVAVMTHAVVLIAVPPGSTVDSMDGLKGKTVGVIAGSVNQKLIAAIVKAYDLDQAKTIFRDISPERRLAGIAVQTDTRLAGGDADLGKIPRRAPRCLSAQPENETGTRANRPGRSDRCGCPGL
jgi:ABC-type nitrate/sulfonate/bicarbonate transport system substrate-binding protein